MKAHQHTSINLVYQWVTNKGGGGGSKNGEVLAPLQAMLPKQSERRKVQYCENNLIHTRYTQMLYINICRWDLNVCGKAWLDSYLNTLTEKDAQKVVEEGYSSSFRFGGGNSKRANKSVTIPARIGNEDIMIKTGVTEYW